MGVLAVMARPPLQIGTWGRVARQDMGTTWVARARYRDADGATRQYQASGRTGAAAERALLKILSERSSAAGTDLAPTTRLSALADLWLRTEVEPSKRSTSTRARYAYVVETYVVPGIGGLMIREATVAAIDRYLKREVEDTGAATAKLCRTVLSGMMTLAVRHGAASANPVRDVAAIEVESKEVRALSLEQVGQLRKDLRADEAATAIDLPDLVDVLLGTGARIGSVLAIRKSTEVDIVEGTVALTGTVVRVKGRGLVRQDTTKGKKSQLLRVPAFTVDVLARRLDTIPDTKLDLLFPSVTGGLREVTTVDRQWRAFRERHGTAWNWVTPHTFRKTVGTLLAQEESVIQAAFQLGHSSEKITLRHYIERPDVAPDVSLTLQRFSEQSAE